MNTNSFFINLVNRKDAGYAELDVTVTSPLGRHLPIEVKGTADGEGERLPAGAVDGLLAPDQEHEGLTLPVVHRVLGHGPVSGED